MKSADLDRPLVVVRAGEGGAFAAVFEQERMVAVGFGDAGSVQGMDRQQVLAEINRIYPTKPSNTRKQYAGQLYRFAQELQSGDTILTPDPSSRELLVGRVAGGYEFREQGTINGDYKHMHPVEWFKRMSRDDLSESTIFSIGSISTIFRPNARAQEELRARISGLAPLSTEAAPTVAVDSFDDTVQDDVFADLESRSAELIKSRLAKLSDDDMEHLVAGILRAMGYHTQVAPEHGGDGGVDVLAARDPLFVEQPIIKVQVKQRTGKAELAHIRALAGVLGTDERGIFVSMGGFTAQAKDNVAAARTTLIDAARLQQLLIQYYDALDQDTKALVPLRRLFFPATEGQA